MRIAVLFDNLGPYHIARLTALSRLCELLAIEQHKDSAEYAWNCTARVAFDRVSLFSSRPREVGKKRGVGRERVFRTLSSFRPDVVAVPGWATVQAISAVAWARKNGVPVIMMSDSQEIDAPRKPYSEWVKRQVLASCDAGLVGGRRHCDYLMKLGMRRDRIRLAYDVVDNEYFRERSRLARQSSLALRAGHRLPHRFFLTSARFIEKKNLFRLIDAFAMFCGQIDAEDCGGCHWHLVLLGDGTLRGDLGREVKSLGLSERILMPGFKQYGELPIYYGLAQALILPSTVEQWGLVVNEAMAAELPVIVSRTAGAACELIREGVNGFTFDPFDTASLAARMMEFARMDEDSRLAMGRQSASIVAHWSPELFATNLIELAELVRAKPLREVSGPEALFLRFLAGQLERVNCA